MNNSTSEYNSIPHTHTHMHIHIYINGLVEGRVFTFLEVNGTYLGLYLYIQWLTYNQKLWQVSKSRYIRPITKRKKKDYRSEPTGGQESEIKWRDQYFSNECVKRYNRKSEPHI